MALWLPAFLAFYPGNYSSDGPLQATTLINTGTIDLHWPAAHTLVLTGLMCLGNMIAGSWDAGLVLYCVVQACLLAFAMSLATDKLIAWKAPAPIGLGLLLLGAINPVVQCFVVSTTKDSFFAAFFLLALVYFTETIRNYLEHKQNALSLALLAASLVGMCLMRKQGLYILVIALILAAIVLRIPWREKAQLAFIGAIVFLSVWLFSFAVSVAFTTSPDSVRETLSLPSQQIVRTYMKDYQSLTDDEIAAIGDFYDLEALEAGRNSSNPWEGYPNIGSYYDTTTGQGYLEPIADPAKGALDSSAYQSDRTGYWSLWASLAIEHCSSYAEAFLWSIAGYLYPTAEAANRWSVMLSPWNEFSTTLNSQDSTNQVSSYFEASLFPSYRDYLVSNAWDMYASAPLLSKATSPGFVFWVLLFVVAQLVRSRSGRHAIICLLLPILYWATLSLGPVMCVRYVVPLFFCIPFICTLPLAMPPKVTTGNCIKTAGLFYCQDKAFGA